MTFTSLFLVCDHSLRLAALIKPSRRRDCCPLFSSSLAFPSFNPSSTISRSGLLKTSLVYANDAFQFELRRGARSPLDKGPRCPPSLFLLVTRPVPLLFHFSTTHIRRTRGMKTMKSRRSGGADRGGIRKRGPIRTDRDGDMDMDRGGVRGAKRPRGDTGRATTSGRPARDRTLDAIQKAISSSKDSQANIRQINRAGGGNLEQFSVRGWKQSKAASNRDGGVESLIAFLERRMNATTKSGPRAKITKVCSALEKAVFICMASAAPCVPATDGPPSNLVRSDGRHCPSFFTVPHSGDRKPQCLTRLANSPLVASRRRFPDSFRPSGTGGANAPDQWQPFRRRPCHSRTS